MDRQRICALWWEVDANLYLDFRGLNLDFRRCVSVLCVFVFIPTHSLFVF